MKKRSILKTGIVAFTIVLLISSYDALALSNTKTDEIDNEETQLDIPPNWIDIGPGTISGSVSARDCTYGIWFDYNVGLSWFLPLGSIIVHRKIHIFPRGEIEWERYSGDDISGDILVNGKACTQFYLTGFRGTFLKIGGGIPNADIYVNNLKVNGYAYHVYVPPA